MTAQTFTLIEIAGALAIVLLVAWLVFGRKPRVRERYRAPDQLDEGVAPVARNQALIDAPSATAAALAATGPDTFGGIGEVIAAGAAEEASAAQAADPGASGGDELGRIKGLGPKLVARLGELGVTSLAQIAAWDEAEQARIDSQLGPFAGRPARDCWIEQARLLTGGDMAAYQARFGRL